MNLSIEDALENNNLIVRTAEKLIGNSKLADTSKAESLLLRAKAGYVLGEYDLALDILLDLEEIDKKSPEVAARISLCFLRKEDLAKAEKWINEALVRNPIGSVKAECLGVETKFSSILANILLNQGKVGESKSLLQNEEPEEKDMLATTVEASVLGISGDYNNAIRLIDSVSHTIPEFTNKRLQLLKQSFTELRDSDANSIPLSKELVIMAQRAAL